MLKEAIPQEGVGCTPSVQAVCDAIRAKQQRFMLQGDEINLNPQACPRQAPDAGVVECPKVLQGVATWIFGTRLVSI